MANAVDQDQQWLLSCLSATLDPNQEVRSFAEASLDQASRQSGFVCCLNDLCLGILLRETLIWPLLCCSISFMLNGVALGSSVCDRNCDGFLKLS